MTEALSWLNLLLVPVCGLLIGIKADISATRATQAAHERRLDVLERAFELERVREIEQLRRDRAAAAL